MSRYYSSSSRGDVRLLLLIIFSVIGLALVSFAIPKNQAPDRADAAPQVNLAIFSDSSSDEYRADDNRGNSFDCPNNPNNDCRPTTLSWGELLVNKKGVNLGTWGNWGGVRRTGYSQNWALSGAAIQKMFEVLPSGKTSVDEFVSQITASGSTINVVYFFIGGDNFRFDSLSRGVGGRSWGKDIYNWGVAHPGQDLSSELQTYVTDTGDKIISALDRIVKTGKVKVIVETIPDGLTIMKFEGLLPNYPDKNGQTTFANAIQSVNTRMTQYITANPSKTILFRFDLLNSEFVKRADPSDINSLKILNEKIYITPNGNEPHHLGLVDKHSGTVASGLVGNLLISFINQALGTALTPFSDTDLLSNAGILKSPSPTPILAAPTLVSPSDASGNVSPEKPQFDWSDVTNVTNYKMQIYTDSSFTSGKVFDGTTNSTASSYRLSVNLQEGTKYYWRIAAIMGSTVGNWSQVYNFTVIDVPTTPIGKSPTSGSLVYVQNVPLAWSQSTSPVPGGYQVQVSSNSGATFEQGIKEDTVIPGAVLTITTKPLARNLTYYWRVRSGTSQGVLSAWSPELSFKIAPEIPTLLTPSDGTIINSFYPRYSWNAVPSATSYTLEASYSPNMSNPFIRVTVQAPTLYWISTSKVSFERRIYWRMYATSGVGNSAWSAVRSFVVLDFALPS